MIVRTDHGWVAMTEHALRRYRERVDPAASAEDIRRALAGAVFVRREALPGWAVTKTSLQFADSCAGAFVLPGFAFAVRRSEPDRDREPVDFVAATVIVKPRRAKEQVRAWREERRAEEWAA